MFGPAKPRRSPLALVILAFGLSIVAVAVAVQNSGILPRSRPQAEPRAIVARGDLAADEKSTVELFERCSRSVVYVNPMIARRQWTGFRVRDVYESATGSGFVWDTDGHIVTNFHVIRDAAKVLVTLPNNTTYEADLAGFWSDKDIAVLRIDAPAPELAPIAIGESKDLAVGQKVFAIGNPFGLDFTLTTGVVSALNREIAAKGDRTIQGVIQTDAAINPGNSGGPLLDSAGRLIGMNTAIYSRSGGSAGIGFAVPVDTINRVVPQLISHGRVIRPGLGINILPDSAARRIGLNGVLITGVPEGSTADKAGLQPTTESADGRTVLGDIIVKVGDTPTPTGDALLNALERYEIGKTVEVTVMRDGREQTFSITLQGIDNPSR